MYSLRNYQENLINSVLTIWNEGNAKVILQLPTGAGKTIIFAEIINRFIQQHKRVLVVAHRRELIAQAHEKIKTTTGIAAGIIQSGFKPNLDCIVQVASIQTLIRNENSLKVDLLIFDEAHHTVSQSYLTILNQYSQALVLGVTATPVRTDGQGFKDIYERLIIGPSVSELVEQGCLSKFKMFGAVAKIKTKGIRITSGDFNLKELSQAVVAADITGDLVPTWKKYAEGKKTILFAIDITHSKECTKAFSDAGIPAEHIDGTTPATERDAILNRFRNGETLVLCNCNIVTEGFDVPTIEAIQCVRPTLSLVLYLQMFGRALRPSAGKEYAILIDHTNNWGIHGLPDTPQDWSLEPNPSKPSAFTHKCPECGYIFQPLTHEIKEIVGYVLYEDVPLSTHYTTCPCCHTQFKFFLGVGKKSQFRQLTLDILEEYGQIAEITQELIPENKTLNEILREQVKITENIKLNYGGRVSHNYIDIEKILNVKSKVYIYGNRVEMYYSSKAEIIQDCYTGTAILELMSNNYKFQLALAEITHNNLRVNQKVLALLTIIGIDKNQQELVLNKIGKTFCFQIKLTEREDQAANKAAKAEARAKKAEAFREEMIKQIEQKRLEELEARRKRKQEKAKPKPQILRIKSRKEV